MKPFKSIIRLKNGNRKLSWRFAALRQDGTVVLYTLSARSDRTFGLGVHQSDSEEVRRVTACLEGVFGGAISADNIEHKDTVRETLVGLLTRKEIADLVRWLGTQR